MEKLNENASLRQRETVLSISTVESPTSPLYSLGNLKSGKSKKKLQSLGGVPGWNRTPNHSPLLI